MKTTDIRYGKAILRVGMSADGQWAGLAIVGGKRTGEIMSDPNRERLIARLRNAAGTLHRTMWG